jgi:hypothetical protein
VHFGSFAKKYRDLGSFNPLLSHFFQVRLKRYLEMRGADGGPWRRLCALPAFWVVGHFDPFLFLFWLHDLSMSEMIFAKNFRWNEQ